MTQKSLLHAVAAQIANGYETAEVPMYSEQLRMPDRKVIIKIIENLQKVFFPAYFAGGTVSHVSAETFAEFLLGEIYTDLCEQVHLAFSNTIKDEAELRERTSAVCDRFLCRLPQIQAMLMKDVAANFDGDPAAGSKEEVIFSYPGLYAIFVYRVAHELYESKVPLIPRIMSEYAHGATGIDINPGAQIGEYFFIDHGTGIVVGETTIIGDHVKLYQGVTLGALIMVIGYTLGRAFIYSTPEYAILKLPFQFLQAGVGAVAGVEAVRHLVPAPPRADVPVHDVPGLVALPLQEAHGPLGRAVDSLHACLPHVRPSKDRL